MLKTYGNLIYELDTKEGYVVAKATDLPTNPVERVLIAEKKGKGYEFDPTLQKEVRPNRLELREKINELLTLEARDRYISTTNKSESRIRSNMGYIEGEKGRNFTTSPSHQYQTEAFKKLLDVSARQAPLSGQRQDPRIAELSHVIF